MSLTNEIRDYMLSVGAVRSEKLTGSDHIKWTLPNGKPYFCSLTPSDNRVLKNIKSDVRRMLGTGNEGGKKAASYSKKDAASGFSMEQVRREQQQSAAVREVIARNTAAVIRLDALLIEAQRNRDQREGERLIRQYMTAKATLERYHQPVPELRCKSNAVMEMAA